MIDVHNLNIKVCRGPWHDGTDILFYETDSVNRRKVVNVGTLTMAPYKQKFRVPEESHIPMNDQLTQKLMDELWNCGFRPSEGTGSAGSLKKTEDHLKDMRKIVSKKLGVEL